MNAEPSIVVIIPAYRVARHIIGVLQEIPDNVGHILVVDDACPEGSGDIAQQVDDPRVEILRHQSNRGVGGALKTGFARALELGCDVVVKLDGDGQMDARQLPRLVASLAAERAAYSKGTRFWEPGHGSLMPVVRRIGNLGLSFLAKVATGHWNVFDPTNGYTAIRADVLRTLDWRRVHDDYFFEIAMLIELGKRGYRVIDIPMAPIYADETSSLSIIRTLFTFPPLLLVGTLRRIIGRHFWYDFTASAALSICGMTLSTFGALFGAHAWMRSIDSGTPATAGTVMVAALPFLTGIDFLLHALSYEISGRFTTRISPDNPGA